MGQILSNIVRCVCGDEGDDQDEENPTDVQSTRLLCLALPIKSSTSGELLQTLPSLPPRIDSCSDSSTSNASIPPSDIDDVHGDSTITDSFRRQNLLTFQQSCLDSLSDSSTAGALQLLEQEVVLISSPSSESLLSNDSSSVDAQLQQGPLTSLPPWLESLFSQYSSTDGSSDAVVVDEKKQLVVPLLSQVPNLEEPRERDEEEKVNNAGVVKEIWMKHYCSCHKILLVGDGDFSFSASLAVAFGSAANMTATSLNSREYLRRNYRNALSNIQSLSNRGATVVHGVDATNMANHILLKGVRFDRIVYNFPLAGFFPDESRKSQLHRYRELVRLFMANAKKMITERGEIHVTHKTNGFFLEWNLEQLASSEGLRLIEKVHFNYTDYPGYRTKYGFGGDKNFNCNPSKTYKFGLKNRLLPAIEA